MLAENGCLNVNRRGADTKTGGRSLPFRTGSSIESGRAVVEAQAPVGLPSAPAADHFDGDVSEAVHAQRVGRGRRHVDDAAADERPAIVDAHDDRSAGLMIGDPNLGPERQGCDARRSSRKRSRVLRWRCVRRNKLKQRRLVPMRSSVEQQSRQESRGKHKLRQALHSHDRPFELLMGVVKRFSQMRTGRSGDRILWKLCGTHDRKLFHRDSDIGNFSRKYL